MAKKRSRGAGGPGKGGLRVVRPATTALGAAPVPVAESEAADGRTAPPLAPLLAAVDPQELVRTVLRRLTAADLLQALQLTPYAAEALAPTGVAVSKRVTLQHGKALLADLRALTPPWEARDLLDVVVLQVDLLDLAGSDDALHAWLLADAAGPPPADDVAELCHAWAGSPAGVRLLAVAAAVLEGEHAGVVGVQWAARHHPDVVAVPDALDLEALRREVTDRVLEGRDGDRLEVAVQAWGAGQPAEVLDRVGRWWRETSEVLHPAAHTVADLARELAASAVRADEVAAEAEEVVPALLEALAAATAAALPAARQAQEAELRSLRAELQEARQRLTEAELAHRHAQEAALAQARRSALAEADERVEQRLAEALAATPDLAALTGELQQARAEARAARAEAQSALADQDELAALLDGTRARLRWWQGQVPEAVEPEVEAEVAVTGVVDALERTRLTHVRLGDTTGPAAELDAFGEVARVWGRKARLVLQTLDAYVAAKHEGWAGDLWRWLDGDAPSGAPTFPRGWYAPLESDTVRTMERFRVARVFPAAGTEVFMEAHVRLASGGEPGPRLHLWDDTGTPGGTVWVGYVGRHLPNTMTS